MHFIIKNFCEKVIWLSFDVFPYANQFYFLFVCVTYITFCAPYVVMEPAEFVNIDIR